MSEAPAQNSHGHLELLHPLPLHVFRLAEELEALLSLEVNQVEAIGPLWGQRHAGSCHGFGHYQVYTSLLLVLCMYVCACVCV